MSIGGGSVGIRTFQRPTPSPNPIPHERMQMPKTLPFLNS